MWLTEHFTLEELMESDLAVRNGIDNTPPADIMPALHRTAEMAETVRAKLCIIADRDVPVMVSSGYRCEALEKLLCMRDFEGWCQRHGIGLTDHAWHDYFIRKAHPRGRAIDFRAPACGSPFHIVRMLAKDAGIMAIADQLIQEGVTRTSGGWVHLSWSPAPRHEILTATFDQDGRPYYEHGLT